MYIVYVYVLVYVYLIRYIIITFEFILIFFFSFLGKKGKCRFGGRSLVFEER